MSENDTKWIETRTQLVEPAPFAAEQPAVEVAAMLEDSVVDVKHVMHDRSPHETRRVLAWFAIGALLLAMAGIAFGIAVSNAADNEVARRAWEDAGKPLHDFRPHRISLAYDWMAFGGLIAGLAAIGFGLWRRRASAAEPTFRTHDEFPLVAPAGDGFVCNYRSGMDGQLVEGGRVTSLAEAVEQGRARPSPAVPGAYELPIPNAGRVRVHQGRVTYVLATVPPPRRQPMGVIATIESRVLAHFAGSAIAHAALLALIYNIPPAAKSLAYDSLDGSERYRLARITPKEEVVAPPTDDPDQASDDPSEGNAGGAETGESGKMGIQESTNETGRHLIKRRRETPEMSKGQAIASARSAGILRAFNAAGGRQDPFATMTGTTLAYSSGIGDRDIYGGFTGDEYRDAYGGWGSGVHGMGPGGGGDHWGTIGVGDFNTIGDGGPGNGPLTTHGGPPGPRLHRDSKAPPKMTFEPVESGEYDKAIIRRHVKKRRGRLRHCYEKQLLVEPKLEGTVTTVFIINGQGAVISMTASGMGNEKVERCVGETIESIQFPKPPDGGLHRVTYPFHFHPAGG